MPTRYLRSSIPCVYVDFIDMRRLPDGDYKWICHAIDHWSKFNLAIPIETKEAESVVSVFETAYIFLTLECQRFSNLTIERNL